MWLNIICYPNWRPGVKLVLPSVQNLISSQYRSKNKLLIFFYWKANHKDPLSASEDYLTPPSTLLFPPPFGRKKANVLKKASAEEIL